MKLIALTVVVALLLSCKTADEKPRQKVILYPAAIIPAKRTPKAEAVQTFTSKNDGRSKLKVLMYETPQTFDYAVKIHYGNTEGKDTFSFPNLGKYPEPVIQEGPEKSSCIVGFMDNKNEFRELVMIKGKMVSGPLGREETIKIKTLQRYGVYATTTRAK